MANRLLGIKEVVEEGNHTYMQLDTAPKDAEYVDHSSDRWTLLPR